MTASPPDVIFPNLHTQTAAPAGDGRDGCDCPPWVIRCAHLGDDVIVMCGAAGYCATCGEGDDDSSHYLVIPAFNKFSCLACRTRTVPERYMREMPPYWGTSYDEALAAFYAAEEALIRGDA